MQARLTCATPAKACVHVPDVLTGWQAGCTTAEASLAEQCVQPEQPYWQDSSAHMLSILKMPGCLQVQRRSLLALQEAVLLRRERALALLTARARVITIRIHVAFNAWCVTGWPCLN